MKKLSKALSKAFTIVGAVLLALVIVVNLVVFTALDKVFDAFFVEGVASSEVDVTKAKEDALALCEELEEEGAVLLENNNDALPLHTGKINLLGYKAYDFFYIGRGSGSGNTNGAITFQTALKNAGFEINPALTSVYGEEKLQKNDGSVGNAKFEVKENPLSDYTGNASFESMKSYSDTAVIVLGRDCGEGKDLTDGYLSISAEERALIEKSKQTFSKVVVILNTANAMELGFLEEYDIDACLWVGYTGLSGTTAIANILSGKVSPSGRLADTYAYDTKSAPSANQVSPMKYTNIDADYGYTMNYAEGIYVGYRWYETAGVEDKIDYDKTVQYPFGYGLSYTTFHQSITGGTADGTVITKDSEITLQVTVDNTGDKYDAKDVVQVYYTAPYTNGGLEKSAVDLVAFDKVDVKKGDSSQIELSFKAEDMASYDRTANGGKGAYVLEAGEYIISLRQNAHEVIDTITVKVEAPIVFAGENCRSTDLVTAENLFDGANGGVTYLSRKDGFANYDQAIVDPNTTASEEIVKALTTGITEYTNEGAGQPLPTEQDNGLTFMDMIGVDYDDPKWDLLISQMKVNEMLVLIGNGGYATTRIPTISKDQMKDSDGPAGICYYMNADAFDTSTYVIESVVACTWNVKLAEKYGETVGQEANVWGFSGWYAPAVNIHRTPYGGRNFEYYSEDSLLSGKLAAGVCRGATQMGVVSYVKHFALNDQENNRTSMVCTWANEQAMRQIYLKPFELAVKEGKTHAIMSSYNFIGTQWTGACKALCTDLLRNEWGFKGVVISDYGYGFDYMKPDVGIRAGNDMMLSTMANKPKDTSSEGLYFIQKACKNILYSITQTRSEAGMTEIEYSGKMATWRVVDIAISSAIGVIGATLLVVGIVGLKKKV